MYKIIGDGTWQNTKVWKDDVLLQWENLVILVDINDCIAYVDTNPAPVSKVLLLGIYQLIGEGKFSNTKLIVNDSVLRGVSSIRVEIPKGKPTTIDIKATFLPNIIEKE
jgi:hypothetical protein